MSDIFFTDPSEAPVPPQEVRIREFTASPRQDGTRVNVHTAITPFQQRPNIEVHIRDASGNEVAALSVVEAIDPKMDFTMHLRGAQRGAAYTATMRVFYADVEAHQAANGGTRPAGEILEQAKQIIDQREINFEIPLGQES